MKPYGLRNKIRHALPGHKDCSTCKPSGDINKKRERSAWKRLRKEW
jgi:hypothetical protein